MLLLRYREKIGNAAEGINLWIQVKLPFSLPFTTKFKSYTYLTMPSCHAQRFTLYTCSRSPPRWSKMILITSPFLIRLQITTLSPHLSYKLPVLLIQVGCRRHIVFPDPNLALFSRSGKTTTNKISNKNIKYSSLVRYQEIWFNQVTRNIQLAGKH